jgi:hypothetical protein
LDALDPPLTAMVIGLPGVSVESVIDIETGPATVNVVAGDRPPPGAGLSSVRVWFPATATSLAEIAAVSVAESTKVVGFATPSHCTTMPGTNRKPFVIVRVNAGLPAETPLGWTTPKPGTGLPTRAPTLVASFDIVLLANHRTLHSVPRGTVVGIGKDSVADVTPVVGAVFNPFMYRQSMNAESPPLDGQ